MRDSARTRAFSRLSQLYPAPTHGSPFCEWHRQLALAATRLRSRRCPIPCSSRHMCRPPPPRATRPGRLLRPAFRHPPPPPPPPHQPTATARRPSVRIAQPRSTPCAIAPVASSARFRGSLTSGFRLAGTSPIAFPSIPAPSRDFAAKSELSCPNLSPESPGPANRALIASPGPSQRCRNFLPRSPNMLRFHENHALQPACAMVIHL